MSWFRLDDQGAFHAKVLAAGNEAYGAWCRAGQWSCSHLTEGHVPRATAFTIAPPRVWKKLVEARLVDMREDESFQIHDFLDWNPTAEEVVAKRTARSEAGRRGGQRSVEVKRQQTADDASSKRQANAKQTSKQLLEQTPSKPEASAKQNSTPFPFPFPFPREGEGSASAPPPQKPKGSSRGTRLPEDWAPSASLLDEFRREHRIDASLRVPIFKNHWLSTTKANAIKSDWDRAFRVWVLRDIDDGKCPKIPDELPLLRLPNRAELLAHDLANAPDMTGFSLGATK